MTHPQESDPPETRWPQMDPVLSRSAVSNLVLRPGENEAIAGVIRFVAQFSPERPPEVLRHTARLQLRAVNGEETLKFDVVGWRYIGAHGGRRRLREIVPRQKAMWR